MPKARTSSSRRRMKRFEEKYTVKIVPLRYKTQIDHMEEKLAEQLPIFVDLEQPIMDECQAKGVVEALWPYYIGFGKRAKSFVEKFSSASKEVELSSLVDEYVKRGLEENVLNQILGIVAPWILGVSRLGIQTRLG